MLYTNTELARKLKARKARKLRYRIASAILTGLLIVALVVLMALSVLAGIIDWLRLKLQRKFVIRQINVLDNERGWKFHIFEAVRKRG
jgi:hypothetical protein